jgi:outer membrane protein assembly factor BamE (lipoprotein component of BamABCDE complex)
MTLSRLLVCLCVGLGTSLAQAPTVTATKWVDYGKKRVLLRKINGRWWSEDNREVYPPSKGGVFWVLDSKPGVCEFFHHRPFQMARAESLHLWMTKDEVEAALGAPNRTFEGAGFWYYYARDGTKLEVRFMAEGVLGEAKYDVVGEKSWPVTSIERELAGRSIYKLLQERATSRLDSTRNVPTRYSRSSTIRPNVVIVEQASSSPPTEVAPKRTISSQALASIKPGASRQDVVKQLGEPMYRSGIAGEEGSPESLTYYLDNGQAVVIRLINGAVISEQK